jgi:hypothetical protein
MNTKRWLMTASLMARGCGATFEQLQARAALDLECQPAAISAHSVEGQTRVASGCGKQAIYVETCSVKTGILGRENGHLGQVEERGQWTDRRLSGVRIPGSGGKSRACSAYP